MTETSPRGHWWVVMTDRGYQITEHPQKGSSVVRGPFASYDDAESYKQKWELQETSRERVAAYVVILWLCFGAIVFSAAVADFIKGFLR
jgi:hypothetical protein